MNIIKGNAQTFSLIAIFLMVICELQAVTTPGRRASGSRSAVQQDAADSDSDDGDVEDAVESSWRRKESRGGVESPELSPVVQKVQASHINLMNEALNLLLLESHTNVRATNTNQPEEPELVLAADEIHELQRKLDGVLHLFDSDKEKPLNFMDRLDKNKEISVKISQIRRSREMKIVRGVLLRQQQHVHAVNAAGRQAASFSITSALLNQPYSQIDEKFNSLERTLIKQHIRTFRIVDDGARIKRDERIEAIFHSKIEADEAINKIRALLTSVTNALNIKRIYNEAIMADIFVCLQYAASHFVALMYSDNYPYQEILERTNFFRTATLFFEKYALYNMEQRSSGHKSNVDIMKAMKLLQLMVINEMDADYDHALQVGDYRDNIAILTARYVTLTSIFEQFVRYLSDIGWWQKNSAGLISIAEFLDLAIEKLLKAIQTKITNDGVISGFLSTFRSSTYYYQSFEEKFAAYTNKISAAQLKELVIMGESLIIHSASNAYIHHTLIIYAVNAVIKIVLAQIRSTVNGRYDRKLWDPESDFAEFKQRYEQYEAARKPWHT